jgi:hypothetical protein
VSTTKDVGRAPVQRDAALARTLAWVALLLVGAWVAVGVLDGTVRVVDTLRIRTADHADAGWVAVTSLGADLLLGMLWLVAAGLLALGVAVGVAALVLRGRLRRGALLGLLLAIGCATQVLLVDLTAGVAWSFSGDPSSGDRLVAAVGTVVVPIVALVVAAVALRPVLRPEDSTARPEPGS